MAVSVNVGGILARCDLTSAIVKQMRRAGPEAGKAGALEAIKIIQVRSSRGMDAAGGRFKPYSAKYLKLKREAGRWTGHVNLTLSGDLLRSLKWLSMSKGGFRQTIGWGDHVQHRARQFSAKKNLRGVLYETINGRTRRRASRSLRAIGTRNAKGQFRSKASQTVSMAEIVEGLQDRRYFFDLLTLEDRAAVAEVVTQHLAAAMPG